MEKLNFNEKIKNVWKKFRIYEKKKISKKYEKFNDFTEILIFKVNFYEKN